MKPSSKIINKVKLVFVHHFTKCLKLKMCCKKFQDTQPRPGNEIESYTTILTKALFYTGRSLLILELTCVYHPSSLL